MVGSREDHIVGEVGVSIREKKNQPRPVAGCLIHGKKEPESETSRGNAAALHYALLEGEGIRCHSVSASAGCGTKHRLNASDSSHSFEAQGSFHTRPHPKNASLEGWGYP